jgi:HSP20 family molecular chaperone IbpA
MSYLIKGFVKPNTTTPVNNHSVREELSTSMDTLMDDFFNHNFSGLAKNFLKDSDIKGTYPKVNFIDNIDHFLLEAAIPGYHKEDVNIEIKDNTLIIRGKASSETDPGSKGTYLWREIKRSKFQRSFILPENLEISAIEASVNAGILSIKFPVKTPVTKKSNTIQVAIK